MTRFSRHLSEALILEEGNIPLFHRLMLMLVVVITVVFVLSISLITVDEAVKATGQFIPRSTVHPVQAPEGGILAEFLVKEGELVQKDQLLVRMENAITVSEREQSLARLAVLQARAARLTAFLNSAPPDFSAIGSHYDDVVRDQLALLRTQNLARQSSLWVIDNQLTQKRAEVALIKEQMATAQQRVGVDQQLLTIRQHLGQKHLVSRMSQLDAKRTALTSEGETQRLQNQLEKTLRSLEEVEKRRQALEADLRRQASDELGTANNEIAQLQAALVRLEARKTRLEVRAPASGRVQDMRMRTVGGVALGGDLLMEIVPNDDELDLELHILPRDIGVVRVGQQVTIRVASYDPDRYGTASGWLVAISPFTQLDGERRMTYKGVVHPTQKSVGKPDGANPILPGMWAQGDIILGQRTLLAYLIKPLIARAGGGGGDH